MSLDATCKVSFDARDSALEIKKRGDTFIMMTLTVELNQIPKLGGRLCFILISYITSCPSQETINETTLLT